MAAQPTIINLTPHDVIICDAVTGITLGFFPRKDAIGARCSEPRVAVGNINDVQIKRVVYDDVTGLPRERAGVYYIVSMLVAQQYKDGPRSDLLFPGEIIRDEHGVIKGAGCLLRY
mgnify:CR=1 FL=1